MKLFVWLLIWQFSLTALIPRVDLSQLRLLGNMYEHFIDFHANESTHSGFISFINFISDHYGNMQHEHQDEEEHDQLPFKNFTSGSFFLLNQPDVSLDQIAFLETEFSFTRSNLYPEDYTDPIDHPPSV